MVKLRYGKRVQNRQLYETLVNSKIAVMPLEFKIIRRFMVKI